MRSANDVDTQLKRIGVNFQIFCHAELAELPKILFANEELVQVVRGYYDGGLAILCATNQRVLLVDKKPFYLTIDDMRYEMLADVEFNHRLLDASVHLGTVNKTLKFTAYNQKKLRELTHFVQEQVMHFRQGHMAAPLVAETESPLRKQLAYNASEATDQAIGQSAMAGVFNQPAFINPYGSTQIPIKRRISRYY